MVENNPFIDLGHYIIMPKRLFFQYLSQEGHRYKYGLEVIYRERHIPTILAIFFCSVKYKKVEGKGFVLDSHKTSCYNFNYHSGDLQYVSFHNGDFRMSSFGWADTRIAQFEYDAVTKEHRTQAKKTAQRVHDHLQEQYQNSSDPDWQTEHQPFLSPLEKIILKK